MKPSMLPTTVLIVEDTATTRLILRQGLTQAGYQVIATENGYQAILAFQQHSVDLVLLDVNMPVMDGFECCEALRHSEKGRHIPIIMLTGRDDHESINRAFELGASDFITKPINLRLLLQRVRYGLRDSCREQALLQSQAEQRRLIEQLSEAQAQLLQSEKLASIGLLAAGVAHEINNPLACIKANMQTLKYYIDKLFTLQHSMSELLGQEQLQHQARQLEQTLEWAEIRQDSPELLQDVQEGIDRIQTIISGLINLSDTGNSITKNSTQLEEVIQEVLTPFDDMPLFQGTIQTHLCNPALEVNIDKADLLQILHSLLANAMDAAGPCANLDIITYREGQTGCVEIQDNGPGIPDKHLQRIFDPFFTTKPPGKGTGLGLSLVYQILKRAEGKIEACNRQEGGACFKVKLPLVSLN